MPKKTNRRAPTAVQRRSMPIVRSGLGPRLGLHNCRKRVDRGLGARSMRKFHIWRRIRRGHAIGLCLLNSKRLRKHKSRHSRKTHAYKRKVNRLEGPEDVGPTRAPRRGPRVCSLYFSLLLKSTTKINCVKPFLKCPLSYLVRNVPFFV